MRLDTIRSLRCKLDAAREQNEVYRKEIIRLRSKLIDAQNEARRLENTVKQIVSAYGEHGLSDKHGETVAVCVRMSDKAPAHLDSTEVGRSIIVEVWDE